MINYSNINRYDNLEFGEYLKFPGFSHSFLKREDNGVTPDFVMNDNIMLGSIVDSILTEPHKVKMNHPLYPAARDIASKINAEFGAFFNQLKTQVSYTAEAEYKGFTIKTTGRLDFELPKHAVLDLKITKSTNIKALIGFMGYENQVWNYAKMANVKDSYLLVYSITNKKTELHRIDCRNEFNPFWADKIIKFGTVK